MSSGLRNCKSVPLQVMVIAAKGGKQRGLTGEQRASILMLLNCGNLDVLSTAQMIEPWDVLQVHQVSLKRTPSILLGIEDGLGSPVSVHLLLSRRRG
jgi:hypothetical protein